MHTKEGLAKERKKRKKLLFHHKLIVIWIYWFLFHILIKCCKFNTTNKIWVLQQYYYLSYFLELGKLCFPPLVSLWHSVGINLNFNSKVLKNSVIMMEIRVFVSLIACFVALMKFYYSSTYIFRYQKNWSLHAIFSESCLIHVNISFNLMIHFFISYPEKQFISLQLCPPYDRRENIWGKMYELTTIHRV